MNMNVIVIMYRMPMRLWSLVSSHERIVWPALRYVSRAGVIGCERGCR